MTKKRVYPQQNMNMHPRVGVDVDIDVDIAGCISGYRKVAVRGIPITNLLAEKNMHEENWVAMLTSGDVVMGDYDFLPMCLQPDYDRATWHVLHCRLSPAGQLMVRRPADDLPA